MSRSTALYRLQTIDLAADEVKRRRQEIEALLADSSELDRLRTELAAATEVAEQAGGLVRSAHLAVQDQRHKLKETEQALYGGQVHNPRELSDLQAEAESLKRHLETLEDRYLEAMLGQDQAVADQHQAQVAADSLAADRSRREAELRSSLVGLEQRLSDLTTEREAVLANVVAEDREKYEKLRPRLGGIAVALLEDSSCGACGLNVSASTQQLVRGGLELVTCGQCGRVLYGG